MLGEASAPLRALPCPPSRPPRLHWLDSALQAPSWPPALRSRAAHLPGEEGSETAWTMSVDSASSTLVRNSLFLAPGQPGKKTKHRHRLFPRTHRAQQISL